MKLLLILLLLGGKYDHDVRANIQEVEKRTIVESSIRESRDERIEMVEVAGVENEAKVSFYTEEYCRKFNPACLTASGVRFDETSNTCACDSRYAFGTMFRFSYRGNSVVAECTDRGSFKEKYNIDFDLSKGAFQELSPLSAGVIKVKIEKL